MKSILQKINLPIDGSILGIFRIGFGLFMLWELYYLVEINFVKVFLTVPDVQLYHDHFSFLKRLPESLLDGLIVLLFVSVICIILGKFYKVSMTFFFLGFSYLMLLDKAYYNNHLYFVCLLAFLLIFIPADKKFALGSKRKKKENTFRFWHLLVLKLQIVIDIFLEELQS